MSDVFEIQSAQNEAQFMNSYSKLAHKSIVLHISFCQQGCIFQLQHLALVQRASGGLKHMHESMHMCTHHYRHTCTYTQQSYTKKRGMELFKKKKNIELAHKLTAV